PRGEGRADGARRARGRRTRDRGVHAGRERGRRPRAPAATAARVASRPRAAGSGARPRARALPRGLRAATEVGSRARDSGGLPGRARCRRGTPRGAARPHRAPALAEAGTLRGRAARPFRTRHRRLHALHVTDPALPRPRHPPPAALRAHGPRAHPRGSARHRRGGIATRAGGGGRRARDPAAQESPVHAGQDRTGVRRCGERRHRLRALRRAARGLRRGAGAHQHARRRFLRAARRAAPAARPAHPAHVPGRRSGTRDGRRRVAGPPSDRLRAGRPGESRFMATKTWATILTLVLLAGTTHAAAPETDPARRSRVVDAVERAGPAVVNISTEQVVVQRGSPFGGDPLFDQFFRDFFDSRPRRSTRTSLGSGIIVQSDGTILTNEHVILRGGRIHVTLADGREFDAKLVGRDPDSDLAVLRINAGSLPHIALGHSDDLMIGETVIAIGNPFGLSHTVTTGGVRATKRSLQSGGRTFTDFIQTDASINPGNSGGPLLNILGELVGINTAIYGGAQGIGFAIPVDRARRAIDTLASGRQPAEPDANSLAWD